VKFPPSFLRGPNKKKDGKRLKPRHSHIGEKRTVNSQVKEATIERKRKRGKNGEILESLLGRRKKVLSEDLQFTWEKRESSRRQTLTGSGEN